MSNITTVLFDLDGTLADTADDLGFTLNQMLSKRGLKNTDSEDFRPMASSGATGLIKVGFKISPENSDFFDLKAEFLRLYEQNLHRSPKLFSGIEELLTELEDKGIKWGIVTNKLKKFTIPVLEKLNILKRTSCIICGDSTPNPKPHPAPLQLACKELNVSEKNCIYVGDDERDILSAKAAGISSVVALYGYLGNGKKPEEWGGDYLINSPSDLLEHI